jgi:signal transduction histidine kinase
MTSLKLISSSGGASGQTETTLRMGIRRLRPALSSARAGVQSSPWASPALASGGAREELKAAKDAAETAKRKITALLANMEHELRAPLNAIAGFSEILAGNAVGAGGPLQAARQIEFADHLTNASHQLIDIVESIFDLAKFEDNAGEFNPSPTSLDALIADVVARLQPLASPFGVQIRTDLDAGLPNLMIDAARIRQALRSVIDNAIKFSNRNGIVNVRLSRAASGNVVVIVSDTGTGVSRDDIAHVFQAFFHAGSSFTRRYVGAGLGLTYAKSFVEQHNGRIALASERNVGTTVTIELPFVTAIPKG